MLEGPFQYSSQTAFIRLLWHRLFYVRAAVHKNRRDAINRTALSREDPCEFVQKENIQNRVEILGMERSEVLTIASRAQSCR